MMSSLLTLTGVLWPGSIALSALTRPRGCSPNGSGEYSPLLAACLPSLSVFSHHLPPVRRGILTAAAVFTVSLMFRTIDSGRFAAHFHWERIFVAHVLNAVVLAALLRVAIDQSQRRKNPSG